MNDIWDKRWLSMAREVSRFSKDPSKKVGAVAVKDRDMICYGYNGFPSCIEDKPEWLLDPQMKRMLVIHAELNLVHKAAKTMKSLEGSTVYVYGLPPCASCTIQLLNAGVERFVYCSLYDDEHWNNELHKSQMLCDMASPSRTITVYDWRAF